MIIAGVINLATIAKVGGSFLVMVAIIACFVQGAKENSKQHGKGGSNSVSKSSSTTDTKKED